MGSGDRKVNYPPTSLRVKPIFKPKIDQADHCRPKSCFTLWYLLDLFKYFTDDYDYDDDADEHLFTYSHLFYLYLLPDLLLFSPLNSHDTLKYSHFCVFQFR